VSYVHGLGIDQPIAVVRQGGGPVGDTSPITPVTFYPHLDWRGNATSASFAGGRSLLFGNVHSTPPLQLEQNVALSAYASSISPTWAVTTWSGSLLNGQFGESGLQYRRNRYYDPQQGRFTQEDPIGLAGGMNLYGFAGGDPVNFKDPFGLCVWDLCIGEAMAADLAAMGLATLITAAYVDMTNKFGLPSAWFSKSSSSGETSAAADGRAAHKNWDAGPGFQREFRLPSGRRCDALNPETCQIKELKPDNERAKKRGEKQLKDYKQERERETGKEHTTTLETYKPKQP
jgi:RHS repeat-associated protein